MKRILVTGGLGFIGSHLLRHLSIRYPSASVVTLDAGTYAASMELAEKLRSASNPRWIEGDVADFALVRKVMEEGFDTVFHLAAETHVDRSIEDPSCFARTNVLGTQSMLEAARRSGTVRRFVHVSTDEVYGSLDRDGKFTEASPLKPNSPYSASKAGADHMARAYWRTYGLPVVITRCSNNYGPGQHREKLIPKIIDYAARARQIPIYGDGLNIRDWLYVTDHCRALELVALHGKPGEVYNIGGSCEYTNLQIAHRILDEMGRPRQAVKLVADRPGHDRRYAIDGSKIRRELGWKPRVSFEQGLRETIASYFNEGRR